MTNNSVFINKITSHAINLYFKLGKKRDMKEMSVNHHNFFFYLQYNYKETRLKNQEVFINGQNAKTSLGA